MTDHDRETIDQLIALARSWRTRYGPEAKCRTQILIILAERGYITTTEALAR